MTNTKYSHGQLAFRKRRGKRFIAAQKNHREQFELIELQDKLNGLLLVTEGRQASFAEGKEINSLSSRIRKLKRRMGLVDLHEDLGQPKDSA